MTSDLTLGKAGRIEGNTFILPVRVYYEDTDSGGVVYYANYLKFAERARTEMLRHLGIESSRLQAEEGLGFVVRHLDVDYIQPAKLDDLLEVHLSLTKVGGASMSGEQRIVRGGEDLVRIRIKLGCMKLSGGAGRLPEKIRNLLRTFETSD
ncbi:tol-pal system-associated acyl-CoA thioesterase [Magnetovibrio sp.]|uniref:tol-pal system-associated acyl-CoA thioesterase n=1 Tax=Magnetovibrio sp. TaxID=2024836 RepID=UPI002F9256E8